MHAPLNINPESGTKPQRFLPNHLFFGSGFHRTLCNRKILLQNDKNFVSTRDYGYDREFRCLSYGQHMLSQKTRFCSITVNIYLKFRFRNQYAFVEEIKNGFASLRGSRGKKNRFFSGAMVGAEIIEPTVVILHQQLISTLHVTMNINKSEV